MDERGFRDEKSEEGTIKEGTHWSGTGWSQSVRGQRKCWSGAAGATDTYGTNRHIHKLIWTCERVHV